MTFTESQSGSIITVTRFFGNLIVSLALVIALLSVGLTKVFACTIEVVGLRNEFRRSKNIFIGEVITVEGIRKDKLPTRLAENWNQLDRITLRIKKAWKGKQEGTVTIYSNVYCECPMRSLPLEKGAEFIIFSDGDSFASACSYRNINTSHDRFKEVVGGDVRRLNNFWFRAWAGIYPF